jgi:hypothetical protein
MELTFILMLALSLAAGAHGQTAITQDNIYHAVDACLAEDPVAMNCPNTGSTGRRRAGTRAA